MTEATLIKKLTKVRDRRATMKHDRIAYGLWTAIEIVRAAFAAERKRAQRKAKKKCACGAPLLSDGTCLRHGSDIRRKRNQPKGGADK